MPSQLPDGIELEEQMGFELVTAIQRELLRVEDSLFQIDLFRRATIPKDFADTVAVMRIQGKSPDWPHIEHWCAQHDALDVPAEAPVVWEADARRPGLIP